MKDDRPAVPTSRIGRCGELLVQYRLLCADVESAAMTTDAGIDLVAFHPETRMPFTIQVKTNLRPKPGGGKGRPALDWWVPENSPAQFVALVDLSSEVAWLLSHGELDAAAQQRSGGRLHFYMYTEEDYRPRRGGCHVREFERFLLPGRLVDLPLPGIGPGTG